MPMPSMTVSSLANQVDELSIGTSNADTGTAPSGNGQPGTDNDINPEFTLADNSTADGNGTKNSRRSDATNNPRAQKDTENVTKNILLSSKAATLDRFSRSGQSMYRDDPTVWQKRQSTRSAAAVVMAAAAAAAHQQRQQQQFHLAKDSQHLFESATSVLHTTTTMTSSNQQVVANVTSSSSGVTTAAFLNVVGRQKRGSAKLQPSPSSASSHSATSSLFRDDGFEDDLTSTASERTSGSSSNHRSSYCGSTQSSSSGTTNQSLLNHFHQSISQHQNHRLSFQGCRSRQGNRHQMMRTRRSGDNLGGDIDVDDEDDQYQSCGEEFVATSSNASGTAASNFDDFASSTTSSSININGTPNDAHLLGKLPLADIKQQYRRSLLLEHQHYLAARRAEHTRATQNRITSLQVPPPLASHLYQHQHYLNQSNLSSCPPSPQKLNQSNLSQSTGNSNNSTTTSSSTSSSRLHHPTPTSQATKCDDRTVNIIGHMPTRSPGYWDSNLSITQRVVTEIIETERTYVDDLEQIVTGYICYLRNVLKKQKQQQNSVMNRNSNRNKNDFTTNNNASNNRSIGQHNIDEQVNTMVSNHHYPLHRHPHHHYPPTSNGEDYQHHHLASNSVGCEDEDRSMLMAFDDDTTSALNEVDDYDVEEPDNDYAAKEENMSLDGGSSHLMAPDSDPKAKPTTVINASNRSMHNNNKSSNNQQIMHDSYNNITTTTPGGALISSSNIKKLFSNLEDIYKFNKDLLFRLEECYLNPSSVAECFVENASGFEIYTHYCTSYPQVVSTLTELMADPKSAQLLKERQNELNQSLPLGAYLLKPVQRILKYHILFQSLIKHTADDETVDEKDRQLIGEAFSVMTSIGCHINAMKKRHEHSIRVQEVQGLLRGWEGPDLTTLGELILEDTFKLFDRQKSNRHLFLFDNVLLITKKKRDGSLCYKGHIECSNLMLIENIKGQPLVFNTVPFDNPKALCAFQAKNLDKKRDWCLQMKEVIIKSFDVTIPVHVRDILMSLTKSPSTETPTSKSASETARAIRAPSYLEKKRTKQDKKK